jgi:hypothetical protein
MITWLLLYDICVCMYDLVDDMMVWTWEGILGWDTLVFMSRCVRVSS